MSTTTKVLWHITMSVDGYIESRDQSPDWMFGHGRPGPVAGEVIQRTGAIVAGRRGFDLGTRAGEGPRAIYGGAWSGPIFVLTHRPADAMEGVTFISGSIEDAVATATEAAGDRDVGVFGADIARQCLRAGLIDEIVVHVAPVLLGDGLRLFESPGAPPVRLLKTRCGDPGQITDLTFEVVR
jgi:dihydrofolate reductase